MIQQDQTGIFGPVISAWWPLIATFLTSVSLKAASIFNEKVAGWPQAAQWTALYVLALGYNLVAGFAGVAHVDPAAPVFAVSAAETIVAALIYKFGGYKV